MDIPPKAVVIVGGGLSGLTAAVQLTRLGVSAALLEDAAELGGRAKTECRDGFQLNYGPHRLYEHGAAVQAFRALNVSVDAAPRGPNGGFAVWRGRRFTLPVGCCSLLTTGLLGARAKREVAHILTSLSALPLDRLERISIADWLRTRVRDRNVIQLVLAMVRYTTYCDDPERQSASAAIDQLRLSMAGAVLYIHHGWASLVSRLKEAAIAAGTEFVTGQRAVAVNSVDRTATSVTVADGRRIPARAVIIATGPQTVRQLLRDAAPLAAPTTATRVATLDVALQRLPNPRAVFALGIDEPWCYSADSVVARVAPPCSAVIHLAKYLRAGVADALADETHLERALDLLQPGWRGLVVHRRFLSDVVVSHGMVAAETGGFGGRMSTSIPHLSNVFLAGDWIGPTGQLADASVASGLEAARRAARLLTGSAESHGAH